MNEKQDVNKKMKDDRKLSFNCELHYNGLMTDWGLLYANLRYSFHSTASSLVFFTAYPHFILRITKLRPLV